MERSASAEAVLSVGGCLDMLAGAASVVVTILLTVPDASANAALGERAA